MIDNLKQAYTNRLWFSLAILKCFSSFVKFQSVREVSNFPVRAVKAPKTRTKSDFEYYKARTFRYIDSFSTNNRDSLSGNASASVLVVLPGLSICHQYPRKVFSRVRSGDFGLRVPDFTPATRMVNFFPALFKSNSLLKYIIPGER